MGKRCLLIVDVQEGLFATPRYDGNQIVRRLNELADRFRASGDPVVFVQHCGPEGDPLHPSQAGHALYSALDPRPEDVRIPKKSCDAFLETDLLALLKEWGVTKLVIGGFATEFCVDTTIRSALALGFETVVPADGHTTADREHLPAAKVIEHHNATWPWLVTPVGGATMMRCAEIL